MENNQIEMFINQRVEIELKLFGYGLGRDACIGSAMGDSRADINFAEDKIGLKKPAFLCGYYHAATKSREYFPVLSSQRSI